MKIDRSYFSNFAKKLVFIITPALVVILVLSFKTLSWKYTITQQIGTTLFLLVLFFFLPLYLLQRRHKYLSVRSGIVLLFIVALFFLNLPFFKILISSYVLFLFLYFKSSHVEDKFQQKIVFMLKEIYKALKFSIESKQNVITNFKTLFSAKSGNPKVFAIIGVLLLPFFAILKLNQIAEQIAVCIFYFISISVILEILERRSGNDEIKKNDFNDKKIKLFLEDTMQKANFWIQDLFKSLFSIIKFLFYEFRISLVVLILILGIQRFFWIKLLRGLEKTESFNAKIELIRSDQKELYFSTDSKSVYVDVRVEHPFSGPFLWEHEGAVPVMIKVRWTPVDDPANVFYEDFVKLDKAIPINSSFTKRIIINRPNLTLWNEFEITLSMVYGSPQNPQAFKAKELKLKLIIETSEEQKLVNLRKISKNLQNELNEQLSLYLKSFPLEFKSNLKLISTQTNLVNKNANDIIVSLANIGNTTFPAVGSDPVALSICWVSKIDKNGKLKNGNIQVLGFKKIPLSKNIYPKESQIFKIQYEPFKYEDVEDVFLSINRPGSSTCLVEGEILELYSRKNLRNNSIDLLQTEIKKNQDEIAKIQKKNNALVFGINNQTISDNNKYKSRLTSRDKKFFENFVINANENFSLEFNLENLGQLNWPVGIAKSVNIGLIWFRKDVKLFRKIIFNENEMDRVYEERCMIPSALASGKSMDLSCEFNAKVPPGKYELWFGLVHEGVCWFYEKGDEVVKLNVTVF